MKVFAIILLITLSIAAIGVGFSFNFFTPETPDEPSTHEHAFGEWETKTPATCTAEGEEVRKCNGCDEEESRATEKLGHTFGEWETKASATCTAEGEEVRKCNGCDEEESRATEKLGHTFGEWQTKTSATCTAAGEKVRACACGTEETETIAQLDHSFTKEVVDEKYIATAKCEEQATYFKSCDCGAKGTETFAYGEVIAHSYGEWQTKTAANCNDAEIEYRACACGKEETKTGDVAALGHNMVAMSDNTHHWTECNREGCDEATEKVAHSATSITGVCTKSDAMKYDVLTAADFAVTATCECEANYIVTEGITLENATLAVEGDNTVTIKLGELSTTVTVNAAKFNKVLSGAIDSDTYVYSNGKDADNTANTDMGTYSSQFRVYFKADFATILRNPTFINNTDKAKVQFRFTVTQGSIASNTTFTLKAYEPAAGVTDVAFSNITWKNVDTSTGSYPGLHWSNGSEIVYDAQGHNISFADGIITVTVAYSEIAEFIDEANGTLVFAFATNTSGVKIASMENSVEAKRPSVSVIINDDHFHVFNQKKAEADYLVSANCTEKAKYYYSCSCGEAGTKTFEYGDVIEHSFGEWEPLSAATCTDAEVEIRKCTACEKKETQTGDAALDHNMETKYNEANHWTECSRCDEAKEPVAHFGGEATETEQAICEGCGQPYGGLASHVHQFSEWETHSPAGCEQDEVLIHTCACGVYETTKGQSAFNHDMQTKFDENSHWTECAHNCGKSTDPIAHSGGEATLTEQAICEDCGQPYGALKEPEKQEYTVDVTIEEDTYISGNSSSSKESSYSTLEYLSANKGSFRPLIKFNMMSVLKEAGFDPTTAKITFTFAVNANASNLTASDNQFNVYAFTPATGVSDADLTKATWNNCSSGNLLHRDCANFIIENKTLANCSDKVAISEIDGITYVTYTLNYSDVSAYVSADGYLVMGFDYSKTVKLYSSESDYAPVIKVTYSK